MEYFYIAGPQFSRRHSVFRSAICFMLLRTEKRILLFAVVELQVFFSAVNYEERPLIAMNLNRVLINMSGHREMDLASYLGQHATQAVRFIKSLNVTRLMNATRVQ